MWATITWVEGEGAVLARKEGVPTLEDLQGVVGGYIEPVDLDRTPKRAVTAWVNEEGKNLRLPPTAFYDYGIAVDTLHGPIAVTASDPRTGDTVALTEEELDRIEIGKESLIDFSSGRMIPRLDIRDAGAELHR